MVSKNRIAGIFEAPPAMLNYIGKRALSIYYGHIWKYLNIKIEKIQKAQNPDKGSLKDLAEYLLVREECKKHARKPKGYKAKAQFMAPINFKGSRYENIWRGGIKNVEQHPNYDPKIKVVVDFKGHTKRGGQWSFDKKQLEVDVSYRFANSLRMLEEGRRSLLQVIRHELQHVAQDYLALAKKTKEDTGLPSKKIRTPGTIFDGFPGEETPKEFLDKNKSWIRHEHREVEFYTNLMDDIEDFQRYMRMTPKPYWRIAARIYTGVPKYFEKERNNLQQEIYDRYGKSPPEVIPSWRFLEFKKKNPGKWKKAVKEFFNEWRKRGVDLLQGLEKPFPLTDAKRFLEHPWRDKVDLRYGFDLGDHKRVPQGWVLEVYEVVNRNEMKKPGWRSKPGKEKWYVLVTPEGKIKQVGGPSKLPSL